MIKWEELNDYIGKPVWDNMERCWRVLDGYERSGKKFYLMFTDSNGFWDDRDIDKMMIYKNEVKEDVSSSD